MKVWVLWVQSEEENHCFIKGVYSSEERAKKASDGYYTIDELDMYDLSGNDNILQVELLELRNLYRLLNERTENHMKHISNLDEKIEDMSAILGDMSNYLYAPNLKESDDIKALRLRIAKVKRGV